MSDYSILRLGDIVKLVQDRVADRSKWNFDKYIAGEHIDRGEVRIKKYGLIKGNEEVIGSAFNMRFKPGHVLYSTRRAYLRKAGIVNFEGVCSNITLVLQANEEKLLQSFLPFILQSEDFVQFAISRSVGSTNPFVKWSDLSKYRVNLPPTNTQRKISQLLWMIEKNIEKTEKLIEVSEKIKNGLLEELLTKRFGHNDSKRTELESIPTEWETQELNELVVVKKKMIDPGQYPSEDFEYYSVPGYDQGQKIEKTKGASIQSSKFIFNSDVILFCKLNPRINRAWLVKDNTKMRQICSTEFLVLVPNNKIMPKYLLYLLKSSFIGDIATGFQKGTSNSHKRVALSDLLRIKVPIPPISEQALLVAILENFDRTLKNYECMHRSIKYLEKALANSFLSGALLIPKEAMN